MTQKRYTEIPKRQKCINKEEPYIGGAKDILDDELEQPQSVINSAIERKYNSQAPNGMGKVVLKKNKSFASQVTDPNTIYVIQYDFTLTGNVTIPSNCILEFDGGSLSNGTLDCNNCDIVADLTKIFNNVTFLNASNIIFEARWFVSRVNETIFDDTLYDCAPELQQAFNSGITHIHFTEALYNVNSTITVSKYVNVTGNLNSTFRQFGYSDKETAVRPMANYFKGIYTNKGITIISFDNPSALTHQCFIIKGVNFISDTYDLYETMDDTVPVVLINSHKLWRLEFDASIAALNKNEYTGIGLKIDCGQTGYLFGADIRGDISGFHTCILLTTINGLFNSIYTDAALVGYKGIVGINANYITANGFYQTGNKRNSTVDNEDGFFEVDGDFYLNTVVWDYGNDGRVSYSIKRGNTISQLISPVLSNNNKVRLSNPSKIFSSSKFNYKNFTNFYEIIKSSTVLYRLFNNSTDEDIPFEIHNGDMFYSFEHNPFTDSGAYILMNNSTAFDSAVKDNVELDITITVPGSIVKTMEPLFMYLVGLVYIFKRCDNVGETRSNIQAFKYLDAEITFGNTTILDKENVFLCNEGHYENKIEFPLKEFLGNQQLVISLKLKGLNNTAYKHYLGVLGFYSPLKNNKFTELNVYKDTKVRNILDIDSNDILLSAGVPKFLTNNIAYQKHYIGTVTTYWSNVITLYARVIYEKTSSPEVPNTSDLVLSFKHDTTVANKLLCKLEGYTDMLYLKLEYEALGNDKYNLYIISENTVPYNFTIAVYRVVCDGKYAKYSVDYDYNHQPEGTTVLAATTRCYSNNETNVIIDGTIYEVGHCFFNSARNLMYTYFGRDKGWFVSKAYTKGIEFKGNTASRPKGTGASGGVLVSGVDEGFEYYDTTLNKPIYASAIANDGTVTWVDATGTTV